MSGRSPPVQYTLPSRRAGDCTPCSGCPFTPSLSGLPTIVGAQLNAPDRRTPLSAYQPSVHLTIVGRVTKEIMSRTIDPIVQKKSSNSVMCDLLYSRDTDPRRMHQKCNARGATSNRHASARHQTGQSPPLEHASKSSANPQSLITQPSPRSSNCTPAGDLVTLAHPWH